MSPEFAEAIDPLFEYALDFEKRIQSGEKIDVSDERDTIIHNIEVARGKIGSKQEWELAIYAFCSWVDGMVEKSEWSERTWWYERCLERKFFNSRDAYTHFFEKASVARDGSYWDSLEVYFLAVALGFEGAYSNSTPVGAPSNPNALTGPLADWAGDTARVCPKQGLVRVPGSEEVSKSDTLLHGRRSLLYTTMAVVFLAVVLAMILAFQFLNFFGN
jgi:type VI secretion system protein ImpK